MSATTAENMNVPVRIAPSRHPSGVAVSVTEPGPVKNGVDNARYDQSTPHIEKPIMEVGDLGLWNETHGDMEATIVTPRNMIFPISLMELEYGNTRGHNYNSDRKSNSVSNPTISEYATATSKYEAKTLGIVPGESPDVASTGGVVSQPHQHQHQQSSMSDWKQLQMVGKNPLTLSQGSVLRPTQASMRLAGTESHLSPPSEESMVDAPQVMSQSRTCDGSRRDLAWYKQFAKKACVGDADHQPSSLLSQIHPWSASPSPIHSQFDTHQAKPAPLADVTLEAVRTMTEELEQRRLLTPRKQLSLMTLQVQPGTTTGSFPLTTQVQRALSVGTKKPISGGAGGGPDAQPGLEIPCNRLPSQAQCGYPISREVVNDPSEPDHTQWSNPSIGYGGSNNPRMHGKPQLPADTCLPSHLAPSVPGAASAVSTKPYSDSAWMTDDITPVTQHHSQDLSLTQFRNGEHLSATCNMNCNLKTGPSHPAGYIAEHTGSFRDIGGSSSSSSSMSVMSIDHAIAPESAPSSLSPLLDQTASRATASRAYTFDI